jgi:comEA protein
MLDLTPSEKRVIFLIIFVLLTAAGFQLIQPFGTTQIIYDYSQPDSVFSRLSHRKTCKSTSDSEITRHTYTTADSQLTYLKLSVDRQEIIAIDINKASEQDFTKLPRIGPAIAKRIINYRQTHGPFKSLEDIKKVKGIGAKTFIQIKPFLKMTD